ncbi:twin-arginine translocase TatA/TatE family subunit [Streptomyces sp. NPDC001680]
MFDGSSDLSNLSDLDVPLGVMVFNLSPFTLVALALIAMFLYGPDRLPKAVGEAARGLRRLRTALRGATDGVRRELGPEYQDLCLRDLNPRAFVAKHLLADDTPWDPPKPQWQPGPKPADWPAHVPFPSAAEMGMPEDADPFSAPIPRERTAPPAQGTSADAAPQEPVEETSPAAAAEAAGAGARASAVEASAPEGGGGVRMHDR